VRYYRATPVATPQQPGDFVNGKRILGILAASILPLALLWVAGNVAPVRAVFIPAQPRFGGGE